MEQRMDLIAYRNKEIEKKRTDDLMALIPGDSRKTALDIGAWDGWFSLLLAERFERVTALDLEKPSIAHPKIQCVKGDATNLAFDNDEFDLVFCAEVLEHIPSNHLQKVCSELERVTKKYILIGVPFKQDIRVGRTKCHTCGKRNPSYGHINSFDEHRLKKLFPLCEVKKISFVGLNNKCTNLLSMLLLDLAGNPYGSYQDDEWCLHCGARLKRPLQRNILQKVLTRMAVYIQNIQQYFHRPQPNWIHILFEKRKV
ncbi:MAG: class I SAM-dependent methyltransferase [bacterium]